MFFLFNKRKKDADNSQRLLSYYKAELELNELYLKENAIFNSTFKATHIKSLVAAAQKDTVLNILKQAYDRQVSSVKEILRRRALLKPIPDKAFSLFSAWQSNYESFLELIEIIYFDTLANIAGNFDSRDKNITQQHLIKWGQLMVQRESEEKKLQKILNLNDIQLAEIKNEAKANYSQEKELDVKDAASYNNRAASSLYKGEYDKAIADCNAAIALLPTDAKFYYNRGLAYSMKHDWDKGISDLTTAIKIQPTYAVAYYNRGACYFNIGEHDKSEADYDMAQKLGMNIPPPERK